MKLLADECCDALLVTGLRQDGHDVRYVTEFAPGEADESILQQGAAEERILLTEDKDFGDLVIRLRLPVYGIVLLRLNPADSQAKLCRMRDVLSRHASRLPGCFVVVDRRKTRLRPLSSP